MLLLEQPEKVTQTMNQVTASKASSATMKQTNSPASKSKARNWSPIGFLEEKLNNPQARSNLKKVSNWIDKAKAQLEEMIENEK